MKTRTFLNTNRIIWWSLILLAFLMTKPLIAQEKKSKNPVLLENISGKYTGDLKKGLAHGKGIAEGKERYEGSFKKGYPNGTGTYYYMNGNVYIGKWTHGKRNGAGKMFIKTDGTDSIITGFWKYNEYVGKEKHPVSYKITYKINIDNVRFNRLGDGNRVNIFIKRGGVNLQANDFIYTYSSGVEQNSSTIKTISYISFPFKGSLLFSVKRKLSSSTLNCELKFTIIKPGSWDVIITN